MNEYSQIFCDRMSELRKAMINVTNEEIGLQINGITLNDDYGTYKTKLKETLLKYGINNDKISFKYHYSTLSGCVNVEIYYDGNEISYNNKYIRPSNYREPTFVDILREVSKQDRYNVDITELETLYEKED